MQGANLEKIIENVTNRHFQLPHWNTLKQALDLQSLALYWINCKY